jgi:phage baseplate assembly protein W|tara:strand:+ start:1211 stop:1585 length:375 start_codon:yes stop_codon:yes gene_type:complete
MADSPTFIGFSTVDKKKPPYTLTDFDLVKRDLLNHFSTRKGERMMLPTFGTIIYDLLMEPMDTSTKELIIEDATRIIEEEPRIKLETMKLSEYNQVILLETQVTYLPDGITEELVIQFDVDLQE